MASHKTIAWLLLATLAALGGCDTAEAPECTASKVNTPIECLILIDRLRFVFSPKKVVRDIRPIRDLRLSLSPTSIGMSWRF